MMIAIVISLIQQRLHFQIFVVFMLVGHDLLELQQIKDQAEGSHEDAGQDLPLEGQLDRCIHLLGGGKDLDAVDQHQGKEYQLQEIADDAADPKDNGG